MPLPTSCSISRPIRFYTRILAVFVVFYSLKMTSNAQSAFPYGVASGDPYSESVVLWTALDDVEQTEYLTWECSEDPDFKIIYTSGSTTTSPDRGGTVKVLAQGLQSGRHYYYRFWWNEQVSPIGRTKTTPAPNAMESIKLGVVSCAYLEAGFFHAYAELAQIQEVDAVVHLGDYIYEYGPSKAPWTVASRRHFPEHEIVSLDDYRKRYAQYRLDKSLQSLHAAHPMIAIWDDHEIANNSYTDGADNHQAVEGDYRQRSRAAIKAYYEWLPVRENNPEGYRSFRFGQMLDLLMIETRLDGRTHSPADEVAREAPLDVHHMISDTQRQWIADRLQKSTAAYRVLGNQTIFSPLNLGVLPTKRLQSYNGDAWDGYLAEQRALNDLFPTVAPVVILTGDSHCSWGFEGKGYVELCTPSITSFNFDEFTHPWIARIAGTWLKRSNANLEYVNVRDHGFLLVEFSQESAKAEWVYVRNIKEPLNWKVSHQRVRYVHPWTSNMLSKSK